VEIRNIKDSVSFKQTITDSLGAYHFFNISVGEYVIKASLIGFTSTQSPRVTLIAHESKKIDNLILASAVTLLNTVSIVSQRPRY
jgi:hypothetical protein